MLAVSSTVPKVPDDQRKKTAGVWKNLQNRNFWMISTLNSILRKSKNKGKIMSERIIKWGFIGCGEVTKYKSGPAFQKIENSEVVAVMSRNGDKAKTYAKERGIPNGTTMPRN